jgi:hypothetical protein
MQLPIAAALRVMFATVLVGCASSVVPRGNVVEGGPNQPIDVSVSGADFRNAWSAPHPDPAAPPSDPQMPQREGSVTIEFDITNVSHEDVEIDRINVAQIKGRGIGLTSQSRKFSRTLPQGKTDYFSVQLTANVTPVLATQSRSVTIRTVVYLTTGEGYAYTFEVPVD